MRHAIAIGILVGILCPVVGSYLIVQRMALFGDVIAHCVLPGLSLSFFLGIDILIGAFISGIFGCRGDFGDSIAIAGKGRCGDGADVFKLFCGGSAAD